MNLPPRSRILFIGGSITDCSRGPADEASACETNFGLGQGYVSIIYAWLGATHPEAAIRVTNRGFSGHTVRDLAARWQTDVIAEKPDTLCVMIGINDVWRQFDSPLRPELAVGPDEFRETLSKLVADAKPHTRSIHLATPFFIEPNRNDAMRMRMDEYGSIVGGIASKAGAELIHTQGAFDAALAPMPFGNCPSESEAAAPHWVWTKGRRVRSRVILGPGRPLAAKPPHLFFLPAPVETDTT